MNEKLAGGRRPKTISLFWKIFDEHFKARNMAFQDILPLEIGTTRTVIYSWNAAGSIPYHWIEHIRVFMEKYDIQLPPNVSFTDIFGPARGRFLKGKTERKTYNHMLYLHLQDLMTAYEGNIKSIHENLVSSRTLLNLPLLMRWIFETGGIAPTRVRAYSASLINAPAMAAWRSLNKVHTIEDGIEHAYRSHWVAGEQPRPGEDFSDFLARVSEGEHALKTKRV